MHRRALLPNQKKNILPCITLTFLSFLKSRSSKGNLDRNTDPIDEDEDGLTSMSGGSFAVGQNVIDCLTPQPTPLLPKKSQINLRDVNKSAYEYFSRKTKRINTKEQYVGDSDADMAFFRSMLPDVKGMTRDQKIKFKIGVLNLIGQILKEPSNSPISYSRSSLRTESPYQRTPSRESEYGSSVQLRSYGSPIHEPALHQTQPTPQQTQITGTYGASELQQTQKTGAYGGPALQQTQTTGAYGGPAPQQTQTTGAYGGPATQQSQTTGAYRKTYLPMFSPTTAVLPHDDDASDYFRMS